MAKPKSPTPEVSVSLETACGFWHARQGLRRTGTEEPAEILGGTGWARTLGGADVYFCLNARFPRGVTREGLRREVLDTAVARGEVRVVPAVRGCIYLVPERDVRLVTALAADLSRPRTDRDLDKAGSSWKEVEDVAAEALGALSSGPRTTSGLRKALPDGAVRSFGAAGKKVGLSSPLPVALRELEFRGEIERLPIGGRLDTERYEWRIPAKPLSEKYAIPGDQAGRLVALVRRFFEFFGPATVKELATWVGVPQRDVKAAMAELPMVSVDVSGRPGPSWVLAQDRDALTEAEPPPPTFSFLAFEDNLMTVHGGPAVLTDPAHHGLPVQSWGTSKPTTIGKARHLSSRTFLMGDRLTGYWEFDPDTGEVAVSAFDDLPKRREKALREDSERLAGFIRDELGHARSFSLDTDDAVRQRAAAIRQMG